MSSTFSAPIRVNTRQTTSNDGTISPDNTGAVVLTQQQSVDGANPDVAFNLPAGSIIHNVQFYCQTAGTSRGIVLATPDDEFSIGTVDTSNAGEVTNATLNSNALVSAYVGPNPAVVYINAGADNSVGVFSITYTARNADGSIAPYGSGYSNN